ncbi:MULTISPECIES: MarR family winged helix-turn-helix transcriptional regulator [Gracilibacillus]|uniref:MarR family winged helix-turn-helix transcriptional regulator n=1 Tax=Gracilibacillus TaxID=74385 RepID=UPI000826529E|nr:MULTISPECIES: MarR family transcriptional regulator [Gracilibacillus]
MDLHQCINFLLSVSQHKVFTYFRTCLEEYNLTPAQYGVLNCLWTEGKISPKRIGELLYLEAPTVSGILDKMQKRELIERKVDSHNRRHVVVNSTEKAEQIRHVVEKITLEMDKTVLQNLSDQEKNVLKAGLLQIIQTDLFDGDPM